MKSRLLDIETYIENRPDSALSVIKTIDTLSLNSNALRAKYSLLHAMALDKNYIDTTDLSVILPAVDYYSKNGSPDERLKAYFYKGRIQMNAGKLSDAAISFSLSERYADEASDYQAKGILYMAFAGLYEKVRNNAKEEEYIQKGISAFEAAGDQAHLNLSSGRLAMLYYDKLEWRTADSLFRQGLVQAQSDTVAMTVFLSNYARMKVVQPDKDPAGSISLLKEMSTNYKHRMSLTDLGVYAYASSLAGDDNTCEIIEKQLANLDGSKRRQVAYWLYLIELNRGNFEKALDYHIEANLVNSNDISNLLSHSVTQTLQDYYAAEMEQVQKDKKIQLLRLGIISLAVVLLLAVVIILMKVKRDKREQELERMLMIAEESNKLLHQSNITLEAANQEYEQTSKELEDKLVSLRQSFAKTYKGKFKAIGELCSSYLETQTRTDQKDIIFRRVEKLIVNISDDDVLHKKFEAQINQDLNNILKYLKEDLGEMDKKESRFVCYCIAGFEPEMIGTLLGLSPSNVYTKKSRLKEKIRNLDSEHKDEYLMML